MAAAIEHHVLPDLVADRHRIEAPTQKSASSARSWAPKTAAVGLSGLLNSTTFVRGEKASRQRLLGEPQMRAAAG